MAHVAIAESKPFALLRLGILYAAIAFVFSCLVGSADALQAGFDLGKFGGLEYVPRVVLISSVRVLGPATSTSAALFALLIWADRLALDAIRSTLVRVAPRVFLMAFVGAAVTITFGVCSGFLTAHWVYGVPWEAVAASPDVLTLSDLPAAAGSFVLNAALVGAFCWFALPAMTLRAWSLAQKIGATWGTVIVVRMVAELAIALSHLASHGIG